MKKAKILKYSFLALSVLVCMTACNKDENNEEPEGEQKNKIWTTDAIDVDLGLTSGTKWAKMNLGATNTWDYGDKYAWGEVETKVDYSWETYKYCSGTMFTFTKYCSKESYGNNSFTDNLTTLESADDAATVLLGSNYSTPTISDWNELCSQCYWVWTSDYNEQNVSGFIVFKAKSDGDKGIVICKRDTPSESYSLSDVHIFLPAAGFRDGPVLKDANDEGNYWFASLDINGIGPIQARYCNFYSYGLELARSKTRCSGLSVRAVRHK